MELVGFIHRTHWLSHDQAGEIYDILGGPEADQKSWTALKHDSGASVKAYTGVHSSSLWHKYKKAWGRSRNTSLLQTSPALVSARESVCKDFEAKGFTLLCEQLIRYGQNDLHFPLHWDIDSREPHEAVPEVRGSELGPGDVIVTLNLGATATLLLEPRYGPKKQQQRRSVELSHGDLYILEGVARWDWLHGIQVPPGQPVRRVVVWRFKKPLP